MNSMLKQYKQMTDGILSPQKIDNWLEYGDWMLLVSNRDGLQEMLDAGELSEDEKETLAEADQLVFDFITPAQLEQFEKREPNLAIYDWWG